MKLAFADPRNMTISKLNMHHGRPAPDVSDIRPSIGQRGVLVPMLVLETVADGAVVEGHFEVVAGARRLTAALAEIAAGVEIDPVPVVVLSPGDDAALNPTDTSSRRDPAPAAPAGVPIEGEAP